MHAGHAPMQAMQVSDLAHTNLLVQDEPFIQEGLSQCAPCLLDDVDGLQVARAFKSGMKEEMLSEGGGGVTSIAALDCFQM